MISHEHARRLAEIETYLSATDPKFVGRMQRRQTRGRSKLSRRMVACARAIRASFLRSGSIQEERP